MKRKENNFSLQWEEEEIFLRINVHKDWLRNHSSRAPCGIGMLIRGILKSCFWISLHQGTLSILCSRIQGYMLTLMNEIDSCLLLPLCVFYEMQNQFFQHLDNVRFTLHDFMSKNFPYRYSETLHACASSGHACTSSMYAYAYSKAWVHIRVYACACLGFVLHIFFTKIIIQVKAS